MIVILVLMATAIFLLLFYRKQGKYPNLQQVLNFILATLAIVQSFKFIYLISIPSLKTIPNLGDTLSQGMGLVDVPPNLETCLNSIGSQFDLITYGLGPLAVIWLSIQSIKEIITRP